MAMPGTRNIRWGLSWLNILAVSATLTYAVTVAARGAGSPAERTASDIAAADAQVSMHDCDPASARLVLYAVANGWLPAQLTGYCGA